MRIKSALIAIVVWQVMCYAVRRVYPYTFMPLVDAAYCSGIGDPQADYSSYSTLLVRIAYPLITTPATVLSLWVFDRRNRQLVRWPRFCATIVAWELAVCTALVASVEFALHWQLNQLDWAIFGPQEVYSFRNLVLPRLLAWLICTVPISCAALWLHANWFAMNLQPNNFSQDSKNLAE